MVKIRACVLSLSALATACIQVAPPKSPPVGTLAAKTHSANEYCYNVAVALDDRGKLNTAGNLALLGLVLTGGTSVVSTGLFINEATDDSPSAESLEKTGYVAIAGTFAAAIAGAVYSYTTKERSRRQSASAEIAKTRALAATAMQTFQFRNDQDATAEELAIPESVASACYKVALDNEERGQQAVEAMIKEFGKRINEANQQKRKAEADAAKAEDEKDEAIEAVRARCGEDMDQCKPLKGVPALQPN